jgi:hypothetical protein
MKVSTRGLADVELQATWLRIEGRCMADEAMPPGCMNT